MLRVLSRVLGTISTTLTTFDSRRQEDALVVSML